MKILPIIYLIIVNYSVKNLNKLLLLDYNIDNYQNLIEEYLAKKNIKAFIPLLFGFP